MMVNIFGFWWQKSMLVIFCMLVTSQSVTNIIICQNMMLVTDMLCWRHEIQPGAISVHFWVPVNKFRETYIGHQHHYTPECDVSDWCFMLVSHFWCWWDVLLSPTSVTNIDVTNWTVQIFFGPSTFSRRDSPLNPHKPDQYYDSSWRIRVVGNGSWKERKVGKF